MTTIDVLILSATLVAAAVQVAVGIGFSVVAGPLLLITLGAKSAVPVLLALNLLVSCIALWGMGRDVLHAVVLRAFGGCLAGEVIGSAVYPYLTDAAVLIMTAGILIAGSIPLSADRERIKSRFVVGIGVVAGIATSWTATPGPVMALGLILSGYDGVIVRRLVQPIAVLAYGAALGLHGPGAWALVAGAPQISGLLGVTIAGSLAALAIRDHLPSVAIITSIRVLSAIAGVFLLARTTFVQS